MRLRASKLQSSTSGCRHVHGATRRASWGQFWGSTPTDSYVSGVRIPSDKGSTPTFIEPGFLLEVTCVAYDYVDWL